MKAAILTTGNEILSGQIHESNQYYIARELTKMGVEIISAAVLPDDIRTIADYVRSHHKKVDFFFISGGIGSTHDDVTRPAVARALRLPLKRHKQFAKILKDFYGKRLNAARIRMADLPDGAALIIPQKYSGAPGFRINNIYVFAGIPQLMREMFKTVKKTIQKVPSFHTTIHTTKREGDFADALHKIQRRHPAVSIGSYPYFWEKKLGGKLVIRSRIPEPLHKATADIRRMLKSI